METTPGPFDLRRFVQAQDPILPQVRAELAAGRKRTHWMWFVFPQLAGLGHSATARHYALRSLDEARAYLDRLQELVEASITYVSVGTRRDQIIGVGGSTAE